MQTVSPTTRTIMVACCAVLLPLSARGQTVGEIQVAPAAIEVSAGASESILVTAYDARGNVMPSAVFTWVSVDATIARVEADPTTPQIATVIGVSDGITQIRVSAGSATATVTVTVLGATGPSGSGPAVSLEIQPDPILLLPSEGMAPQTRFLRSDGQLAQRSSLQWQSLLPTVASVDGRGNVIGVQPGQGVIQASSSGGLIARAIVQVANEPFRFQQAVLSLSPAESDSLRVIVPNQGNRHVASNQLRWASTNPTVAVVATDGSVTGISPGQTEVVAQGFGQEQRLTVTVHRPVAAVDVLPRPEDGTVIVPLHGSVEFTAQFLDANDTPVDEARGGWVVEDREIVSFDPATGAATGREMGTTRVRLRGPSGIEVTWDVRVVGAGVAVLPGRVGLSIGETTQLAASFVDEAGQPLADATGLTWTSLSADAVTIDGSGNVTATGWGHVQVVAAADWGATDTVDVFVQGSLLITKFPEGAGDVFAFDPENPESFNRVTTDPSNTEVSASFSPDGTRIVFVSTATGQAKVYVADADGTGIRALTTAIGQEQTPEWSPDGSQILFEAAGDIWIVNRDGTDARQLTNLPEPETDPTMSMDGATIAYTITTGGNNKVYLMSADGSNQRAAFVEDSKQYAPSWLPDGRLAYIRDQGSGRNRVRAVMISDLSGGPAIGVTPAVFPPESFSISADGSMLAFVVQVDERGSRVSKLYLLPITGQGGAVPVEVPRTEDEQFFFPAFKR